MRADELVDQLHEGSDRYAGRSAAAAGRLRASVLAEFAEVGLPAAAVPYVVEVLRTELNPEVVAAAARGRTRLARLGSRTGVGAGPGHGQSAGSRRAGRPGTSRTALVEVLAALAWQPRSGRTWWRRWSGWVRRTVGLEPGGSSGAGRHVGRLAGADRAGPAGLVGRVGSLVPEPSAGVGDLGGVVVEDQDGVRQPLVDFLGRADTVVAFFYTRCQNPNKCSLTITKLADLQARMLERGLAGSSRQSVTTRASICRHG